ncbi:hypothetical protein M3J09_013003 [Ascochyta lentis]
MYIDQYRNLGLVKRRITVQQESIRACRCRH